MYKNIKNINIQNILKTIVGVDDFKVILEHFKKDKQPISNYNFEQRNILETQYQNALDRWNKCMYKTEHWQRLTESELEFLCDEASLINKELKMIKAEIIKMGNKPYETFDTRQKQLEKKVKRFK